MKRPVIVKRAQTMRPKITTRTSVKIRRPAVHSSPTTRPHNSAK